MRFPTVPRALAFWRGEALTFWAFKDFLTSPEMELAGDDMDIDDPELAPSPPLLPCLVHSWACPDAFF
jgi:hypothetical protein